MSRFKSIKETLAEKNFDTNEYIWHELSNTSTEYGPGWHDLIIELIGKIEQIYKKNNIDVSEFRIDQIKEKYGGLRVYVRSSFKEVHELIMEYENKSETICEECGAIGSLYVKNDYLSTLCEACAKENGYEKVIETQEVNEDEE